MEEQGPRADGPSLETVLREAHAGGPERREALCRVLRPPLLAHLRAQMGSGPRRWIDPEDLAQGVLVEFLRDLERMDETPSADEVLRRLQQKARWRVRDVVRNHRRDRGESALPAGGVAPPSPSPSTGPVTLGDERRWLRELVARLPEHYASVVRLCGLEGRSYADAGETLGLAPDTVRKRYERARQRLADHAAHRLRARG